MGKNLTTALKVKDFTTFPLLGRSAHADQNGYRPLYLRVKYGKKSIDIELYDVNGVRIKVRKQDFNNGKITGGYSPTLLNTYNTRIAALQLALIEHLQHTKVIDKKLIMADLYGKQFLETSKHNRTKNISFPVRDSRGTTIDVIDLKSTEVDELINPLLSKQTFINSDGKPKTIEGVFDPETGESLIESKEDFEDLVVSAKAEKERATEYNRLQEQIRTMPPKERYLKGFYKKDNIFEALGMLFYTTDLPDTYKKILLLLLQYREHKKPSEKLKDLNADWLIDFFKFTNDLGHLGNKLRIVNLNIFDYDKSIFFQSPEQRQPYKPKHINKLLSHTKLLINGSLKQPTEWSLYDKGLLKDRINLDRVRLISIRKDKDTDGTRIEHALTKDEVDALFHLKFDSKKLAKYNKIFKEQNQYKYHVVNLEILKNARDLFILQIMFGGLRGWSELQTAKVTKFDSKRYTVSIYQNKVKQALVNPLNDYTEKILKPLKYKIPTLYTLHENGTKNVSKSKKVNEEYYRALIKTVAQIANLDREFIFDNVNNDLRKIMDEVSPYFARKTFGTILANELGLTDDQIGLFTGHKGSKSMLSANYINRQTVVNKYKLIAGLKVGKP